MITRGINKENVFFSLCALEHLLSILNTHEQTDEEDYSMRLPDDYIYISTYNEVYQPHFVRTQEHVCLHVQVPLQWTSVSICVPTIYTIFDKRSLWQPSDSSCPN